jgi:hypothetical protein
MGRSRRHWYSRWRKGDESPGLRRSCGYGTFVTSIRSDDAPARRFCPTEEDTSFDNIAGMVEEIAWRIKARSTSFAPLSPTGFGQGHLPASRHYP